MFSYSPNLVSSQWRSSRHALARCRAQALLLLVFLLYSAGAMAAQSDNEPVTPYRPSVSNPAQLPAVGQLELELGYLHSKSSDGPRDSIPYLLKLAFSPQWGVLLGGEALVSAGTADTTSRVRGLGDTTLVLKRAFLLDDTTAFGLEVGAKLPTARTPIGSGRADYSLNSIFSRDMGKFHLDVNLNATGIGSIDAGTARLQSGLSAALARQLSEQVSLTTELSATRRGGTASTAQLLLALGYSPNKQMTLDIGFIRGLNPASPTLAFFSGLVIPVAHVW